MSAPTCTECTRPSSYASGLCCAHEWKRKKYGDPSAGRTNFRIGCPCLVDGCEGSAVGRGLCKAHYVCEADGCDRKRHGLGLCTQHLRLFRETGEVRELAPRRKNGEKAAPGDTHLTAHGYVRMFLPDDPGADCKGWVPHHRVVMAEALGRTLTPDESVHHRNGDRADNRIENLELWDRFQPSGQRVADRVLHYLECLERNVEALGAVFTREELADVVDRHVAVAARLGVLLCA